MFLYKYYNKITALMGALKSSWFRNILKRFSKALAKKALSLKIENTQLKPGIRQPANQEIFYLIIRRLLE